MDRARATSRSPSLRAKMIIHPLTLELDTGALLRAPSDVERTFPLKDGTGFIVRPRVERSSSLDYRSIP